MERGVSRSRSRQQSNTRVGCFDSVCEWLRSVNFKIYCDQALSSWGDRMWRFAVGLYLVMLSPSSLRLTAIYGFSSSLSLIIFGAPIGRWIDRTGRLKTARTTLVLQNFFVAVCAVLLGISIYFSDNIIGIYEELLNVAIIVAAVLSDLASAANRISIGKDWIVVVAKDNKQLAYMNAMVRRIDLTTLICAPIVAGQIITYTSMLIAAFFIATWNVVSMIIEFIIITSIYNSTPALAVKENSPTTVSGNFVFTYIGSWKLYFNQKVVFAGIGLSFLYMTVLGFDTVTQGYANQQGVSASVLGGLSALGAVVGILGTLAYPRLRDHIGIERTGLYGFVTEIFCLVLCVISIWMPGSPFNPTAWCYSINYTRPEIDELTTQSLGMNFTYLTSESSVDQSFPTIEKLTDQTKPFTSIALLMTGIVTARFGLWMADLSVNQLLQQDVAEANRGTVNGVQHSLNMIMDMLKFILVIAFPCHESFGYLIIISFVFVCFGWISYCVYSYKIRGHIIPFHKLRTQQVEVGLDQSATITHM